MSTLQCFFDQVRQWVKKDIYLLVREGRRKSSELVLPFVDLYSFPRKEIEDKNRENDKKIEGIQFPKKKKRKQRNELKKAA